MLILDKLSILYVIILFTIESSFKGGAQGDFPYVPQPAPP